MGITAPVLSVTVLWIGMVVVGGGQLEVELRGIVGWIMKKAG